ncbi:MAG: hypothetical protein FJZ57_03845, partial [Chlamydiae bacterium]|nr:hypothetical protein [Chlamydiota bacterium]
SNPSFLLSALLRSAYQQSHEGLDPHFERLPLEIQERIQNTILQNTSDSSPIQKQELALRDVALHIYDTAGDPIRNRVDGAFYRFCGVRNTGNPSWSSSHIRDFDKTEKLFQSLEYVETEEKLINWAGNNQCKLDLSRCILEFINDPSKTELILVLDSFFSEEEVDSLPDIFSNTELKNRLRFLSIQEGNLHHLPDSICDLRVLDRLMIADIPTIENLPDRLGDLTQLEILQITRTEIHSLPESLGNLRNLRHLSCSYSRLRGLPESFGNLERVEEIRLNSNQIENLPQSIGNLRSLNTLILTENRLETIPTTICNLGNLRDMSLNQNQLRDLPNSVIEINRFCRIDLENSGLSLNVINRLRELSEGEDYVGPRFSFSIEETFHVVPLENEIIDRVLASLYAKAGYEEVTVFEQRYPSLYQFIQQNEKEELLRMWMSRLDYMQDSLRDEEGGFSRKILSYLSLAETNENFRRDFFSIIHGATETCGDRMALSILHIGLKAKMATIDRNDAKNFAEFLIHGPWMIEQLENIARAKIQTLRFVDEIEVYLAYPVKLRERLNIQIDVDDMLYFRCSGVTQEDLDLAAAHINEIISTLEAKHNILIDREDWIEFLAQKYPAAIAALRRERNSLLDSGNISYAQIQDKYTKAILDLTKKSLRP